MGKIKETLWLFSIIISKFIWCASGRYLLIKFNQKTNDDNWRTSDEETFQWDGLKDDTVYSLANPSSSGPRARTTYCR